MRKLAAGALVALSAAALPGVAGAAAAPTATVEPGRAQFWPYVDDGRRDVVELRYRIADPDGAIVDTVMPVGTLSIRDGSQEVLRSFSIPPCGGCAMAPDDVVSVVWDGTDSNGALVPPGTYTVATAQTYHYLDPADGTTVREGTLTATTLVETFTGTLTVDGSLVKAGARTSSRRCRVVGWYGDCSSPYQTEDRELLVTTWQEVVTLTYRFRVPGSLDILDVSARHGRGNTACRGYRVSSAISGSGVTVTVSMGGERLSQCWTRKVVVRVSGERTI